jgi:replication factor C subunit 1
MDEYFISREDFDTIIELGVGDQQDEIVNKKISSATKSALTRKYVPFSGFVFQAS